MTVIRYDPHVPEIRFQGHAGAGEAGSDPVCAALSILMYTLCAALGDEGTERCFGDGCCHIRGGERGPYEVVAAGLRLLAEEKPAYVRLEVKR